MTMQQLHCSGMRIYDDRLRRMGPAHLGHINFRGTMHFGIERYAPSLRQGNGEASTRTQVG
jgi:hypothetical protein